MKSLKATPKMTIRGLRNQIRKKVVVLRREKKGKKSMKKNGNKSWRVNGPKGQKKEILAVLAKKAKKNLDLPKNRIDFRNQTDLLEAIPPRRNLEVGQKINDILDVKTLNRSLQPIEVR